MRTSYVGAVLLKVQTRFFVLFINDDKKQLETSFKFFSDLNVFIFNSDYEDNDDNNDDLTMWQQWQRHLGRWQRGQRWWKILGTISYDDLYCFAEGDDDGDDDSDDNCWYGLDGCILMPLINARLQCLNEPIIGWFSWAWRTFEWTDVWTYLRRRIWKVKKVKQRHEQFLHLCSTQIPRI